MSSPLPLKRRKLNDAANTLSKPFVSPLRTRAKVALLEKSSSEANFDCHPYIPSALAHTITAAYPAARPDNTDRDPKRKDAATLRSTLVRKPPSTQWLSKRSANPEEIAAQKAVTSLELQIKRTSDELDALRQAQQIATSSTDADLEELADKWKLATRAVAEELFGSVKERVCSMGGVAAWREMEKRKYDRSHGLGDFKQQENPVDDDADCEFDSEGEELSENEQEYRKMIKRQARKEMMEAADAPEQPEPETGPDKKTQIWADDGKDDDVSDFVVGAQMPLAYIGQTFTMDMMLRSLNIDLAVIGYDKGSQRWIIT